jgi:hypothetical protein
MRPGLRRETATQMPRQVVLYPTALASQQQAIRFGSTVYRNAQYHFSFVMPPGYEVNELPNSNGYATQIIFDDPVGEWCKTGASKLFETDGHTSGHWRA